MTKTKALFIVMLLTGLCSAQTITHVFDFVKENRSTDEMVSYWKTGVQNYAQGGNSPLRCTINQSISGLSSQCITAGWPCSNSALISISGFTGTSGTLTFSTATQSLTAGTTLFLFGFGSTGLNGQMVTVLSTGLTTTQFEAVVGGSGYTRGTGQAVIPPVGWCEPTLCTAPTGPEVAPGDTCPQITTGKCYRSAAGECTATGDYIPLVEENPSTTNADVDHGQNAFLAEVYRLTGRQRQQQGSYAVMEWDPLAPGTNGGLAYFAQNDIPYYATLYNTYGLADNHHSSQGGPSFPSHAFLFAASSCNWTDNPNTTKAGSDSDPGEIAGFNSDTTCGASHSGSAWPYTYVGNIPTTSSVGTQYYGGTCTASPSTSCICPCAAGQKCANIASCSDVTDCGSSSPTCSTSNTIGGASGSPCCSYQTIADVIENGLWSGTSESGRPVGQPAWGYYSNNNDSTPSITAPAYFQNIYFNPTRFSQHVFQDTNSPCTPSWKNCDNAVLDSVVASCTGMCSGQNATACSKDSDCGGNGPCVDSVGASAGGPAGSVACKLPPVVFSVPTLSVNLDHPHDGPMTEGMNWTQARLTPIFANSYVYYHSIAFLTHDDWGGYYDHVAPTVVDLQPTDGFRVPLTCIGPYCKNQITHTYFNFSSELKCIEDIFGLSNINSRDAAATDACAGAGWQMGSSGGSGYNLYDTLYVSCGASFSVIGVSSGAVTNLTQWAGGASCSPTTNMATTCLRGGSSSPCGSGATITLASTPSLANNIDGMVNTSQTAIPALGSTVTNPTTFVGKFSGRMQ